MRTTLAAEGLAKSWGGRRIFSGVSLTVDRGLVAVSGENGSGKTTLLKILAGLLRADAGTLRIRTRPQEESQGGGEGGGEGEATRELAGDMRRHAIGWAGPDLAFYEDLSALENLSFFRRAGGRPAHPDEIRSRLADVGLSDAAEKAVGAFSTGMKQRLRLALATLFDSPILLLDEPMNGLDASGREIASRLVEASRREGAVILASNDARDFETPDQTLALGGGR